MAVERGYLVKARGVELIAWTRGLEVRASGTPEECTIPWVELLDTLTSVLDAATLALRDRASILARLAEAETGPQEKQKLLELRDEAQRLAAALPAAKTMLSQIARRVAKTAPTLQPPSHAANP